MRLYFLVKSNNAYLNTNGGGASLVERINATKFSDSFDAIKVADRYCVNYILVPITEN